VTSTGVEVVGPRPIICVVDDVHRDLAMAEAVRHGSFTHVGVELDLGRRPDWLHDGLPDDVEWRIEWVKLYEGLDLAHAYVITGDDDYLATWEDLVRSFCAQIPIGTDPADVSARRLQNWIYAWQRFAGAAQFTGLRPGLAERLIERIAADADHLRRHLTKERNHRTLELYALLIVGLAFPGAYDDLAAFALDELGRNLMDDVWVDGVHRECSTDYHCIVLRSYLGAIANARSASMELPSEFLERVSLALDFALHIQRPDGITPRAPTATSATSVACCASAPNYLIATICGGRPRAGSPARRRRPGTRRFPSAAISLPAAAGATVPRRAPTSATC